MIANAERLGVKRSGVWALSVPVALAVVIIALVPPARAGVIVGLDPTGGGGANPATTIDTSQLTWAPGNVLAINALPSGFNPAAPNGGFNAGPSTVEYQALLQGINGVTRTGGSVAVVNQQNDTTPANGGDIVLGGVSTGRELFITASFRETLAFNSATNTVTASFAPGTPNNGTIYDAPAGTFKNFAGLGSSPPASAIPILTGSVIASGSEGNFGGTFHVTSTAPVAFNQYGGDVAAQAFYSGKLTLPGTGSTFVPVQVTSANPAYFLSNLPIVQLSFPSISTALPFNSVEPSQLVNGTTPNFGAINQVSGPDVQFQAQAANDFSVVPEPSSIILALSAATMIPSFLYLRWRRSRKTDA